MASPTKGAMKRATEEGYDRSYEEAYDQPYDDGADELGDGPPRRPVGNSRSAAAAGVDLPLAPVR